jgi:hypothetical protein
VGGWGWETVTNSSSREEANGGCNIFMNFQNDRAG